MGSGAGAGELPQDGAMLPVLVIAGERSTEVCNRASVWEGGRGTFHPARSRSYLCSLIGLQNISLLGN